MPPKLIIDSMVNQWLNNVPALFKTDPFLCTQRPGTGLLTQKYIETMPEPFWGSTKNNLAVIIDMNPGFTDESNKGGYPPDNDVLSRENMGPRLTAAGGYSAYADAFPQLCPNPLHNASSDWWLKRMKWLDKMVKMKTGFTNNYTCGYPDLKPFALEIVPWHSARWSEAKLTSSQSTWMNDVIIPLAYDALQGSKLHFILMLGNSRQSRSILQQVGFVQQRIWNSKMEKLPKYWPSNGKGNPTSQEFIIWEHKELGIKILNMTANNAKPPRSDFDIVFQKEIFPLL